jgi:hypothetical protein
MAYIIVSCSDADLADHAQADRPYRRRKGRGTNGGTGDGESGEGARLLGKDGARGAVELFIIHITMVEGYSKYYERV